MGPARSANQSLPCWPYSRCLQNTTHCEIITSGALGITRVNRLQHPTRRVSSLQDPAEHLMQDPARRAPHSPDPRWVLFRGGADAQRDLARVDSRGDAPAPVFGTIPCLGLARVFVGVKNRALGCTRRAQQKACDRGPTFSLLFSAPHTQTRQITNTRFHKTQ